MSVLISVVMITYNHENFIREAIESVVMQKTNFDFELIIGEDCSRDRTRFICEEYVQRYPKIVSLFPPQSNLGMMRNFARTLKKANGEYIAICEGDDYWTDPLKLQKQADFLRNNEKYAGVFHNVQAKYEDGEKSPLLYCHFSKARSISFTDLSYSNTIPTCSVVFRSKYLNFLPSWFVNLAMGDWALHLFNSQYGDFWYIPQIMGVYRITSSSSWAMQNQIRNIQYVIETYDKMIRGFSENPSLTRQLRKGRKRYVLRNRFLFFRILFRVLDKIYYYMQSRLKFL